VRLGALQAGPRLTISSMAAAKAAFSDEIFP
jgi:hypothetical protein